MVRITALMDNKPSEHKALIAEHGLSLYVDYSGFRFLFDCGSGPHFQQNAHRLGVDLRELDAVVLSHSHYDHAAGFRDTIENGLGSRELFTGPHFFEPKYAKEGVCYTDLSAGFDPDFLAEHGIRHNTVEGCRALCPGVWLVSGFERRYEFETIPERFVRRTEDGFETDDFADEICVVLEIQGGLAVLVGCSHPGILNMISQVSERFHQPILAVYGGTHLVEADERRIETTIETLHKMGVGVIGFSHCSGEMAEEIIHKNEQVRGCHLRVGDTIFYD